MLRADAIGTLVALLLCSTGAGAQTPEPTPQALPSPEALVMNARARDAAELYGVAIGLLGTGAACGIYGAARYSQGDTITIDGFFTVLSMPFMLGLGVSLLGTAAGLDAGVTRWNGARHVRRREGPISRDELTAEQRDTSHVITALYVSGITSVVGALIPIIVLWIVENDAFRRDYTNQVDYPLFIPPILVGSAGYMMLLAAMGMDVVAGAWSGAATAPTVSIAPIQGGAALSIAGSL